MFQESYMRKIVALAGIAAIVALLSYSYTAITELKYIFAGPTIITVEGEGEVLATPDLATFSFTVEARGDDAVSAQNDVAEKMDAIRAYLSEAGVEEKDIKTQYFNLSPRYEYPESTCFNGYCPPRGEPTIIGYEVSQSVSVKVRDREKAGEIISAIGEQGAMNVSSLSFTIDDEDALKAEARELAIADAKQKAEVLAGNLDSRIVRMTGYWEEGDSYPMAYGLGGGDERMAYDMAESVPAKSASLPVGENTITVRVNISYEIR